MEVSITDITDVEKEISINVPAAELVPHFDKAYAEYIPKIEIKGFRKGKAPLDMIKKIHGEAIEYDSLSTVASNIYREVVEQRNIKPIGEPALVDMNYKRGETFVFKVAGVTKVGFISITFAFLLLKLEDNSLVRVTTPDKPTSKRQSEFSMRP